MKGHKWHAALFDRLTSHIERTYMKEIRPRLVNGARGRVLEIGAGTGSGLPYYQSRSFEELVITEPDPYMMQRLRRKLASAQIDAEVMEVPAEELPFPDACFDTVLSVHVLCSVQDLSGALAEIRRVLKPEGQLRFFDHVRSRNKLGASMQDLVHPVWSWMGGGCHPNRDIAAAIESAGFRFVEVERLHPFGPVQPMLIEAFVRPHILGVAVPTRDAVKP